MSGMRPGTLVLIGTDGDRLRVDRAARSVHANDVEVHLTPTEFDVLMCLAERAGTVVSTEDIIDVVWGEWFGSVDHVFVHMHHIRRKLGACARLIVTKRTLGYLLQADRADGDRPTGWPALTGEYLELLQADAIERSIVWLLVDQQRTITWASTSSAAHLGWWPSDLVGRRPWEIVQANHVADFVARFPMGGRPPLQSFHTRAHKSDGTIIDVTVTAEVLHGLDGKRLGGIGEWRVRGEGVTAPGIRASSSVPFRLSYDVDFKLIDVEPRQSFLGWDPDTVIGTHFSLTGLNDHVGRNILDTLVASGRLETRLPLKVTCADGTPASVNVAMRVHRESGRITGFTGEVRHLDP